MWYLVGGADPRFIFDWIGVFAGEFNKMKRKLPTIIGVILLTLGVAAGILLIENKQVFSPRAEQETSPKNVRISNITDNNFTVSWTTNKKTRGFVVWNENNENLDKSALEKNNFPKYNHSVSVESLAPETTYFFKINSNGKQYDNNGLPWQVTTGKKISNTPLSNVISGTVITKSGSPLENAIIYVTVSGSSLLSTHSDKKGEWTLNLSSARNQTLDRYLEIDNQNSPVEIFVQAAPLGTASAQTYPASAKPTPPIVIGQTHNFRKLNGAEVNTVPKALIQLPE